MKKLFFEMPLRSEMHILTRARLYLDKNMHLTMEFIS